MNTTIVITGASQGIGKAIAHAFAPLPNVQLALIARNESNLKKVATYCEKQGATTCICKCDVTEEVEVIQTKAKILDTFGVPAVVVNNAGLFQPGAIQEISLADFNMQISVNLTSAFLVTKAFLEEMIALERGHFFFMASVASIRAYAGGAAYCAAKHGLLGLARVVREETKDKGIRVTTLLPGATYTPSWDGVSLPETRFMPAEDIAQTVLDIYQLSTLSVVEEIVIRPQLGDI